MTRFEFAAALNECLETLLSNGTTEFDPADAESLERLQREFRSELGALNGRLGSLEERLETIASQQFSITTRLFGLTFFNLTSANAIGNDFQIEAASIADDLEFVLRSAGRNSATNEPIVNRTDDNPQATLSNLTWLSFVTSFTGKDSLTTQLAFGNGNSPVNDFISAGLYNTYGTPFTDQTAGTNIGTPDVILREMSYEFPVTDNFRIIAGPRINYFRHFEFNRYTLFLNGTSSFNSIAHPLTDPIKRGAGLVAMWRPSDKLSLHVSYLGQSTEFLPGIFNSSSNPSQGLFDATNAVTAELTFSPNPKFNIRFLYQHTNGEATSPIFDENGNITGIGGGDPTFGAIYGIIDDGFGGSIESPVSDAFGINFDWEIADNFGIFGRYLFATTRIDPIAPDRDNGTANAQTFQFGLAFSDIGREGALGTISFLVPSDILSGEEFYASGGGDGGLQYELEAAYYFPANDNVAIVPAVYAIFNPNNFSDNPTILIGNVRAQFSF